MSERKVYPLKCRIRAEADVTRIDVYDDIGAGGWLFGGISAADVAAQLAKVKGALEVHINSGGGDVFDGIAIGNAISAHKGPVTTVVDGLAASIASVVAQSGQDRVVQPGSMMMIHDAWGGCQGNAADMAKFAQVLDKNSDNIAQIYASRAGGTAGEWRAVMREETWYTAEEAVAAGLADRVGDDQAELPDGLDLAAYELPGRIAAALRSLPRSAATAPGPPEKAKHAKALTKKRIRAIVRAELHRIAAAAADESAWDGNAAMAGCSSAADFRAICAGEHTAGDPDQRQHWALPHHKSPGAAPNRNGVNNALSRLPQTQDLKNRDAAQAHLKAHQSAMGGGSSDHHDPALNWAPDTFLKALKGDAR